METNNVLKGEASALPFELVSSHLTPHVTQPLREPHPLTWSTAPSIPIPCPSSSVACYRESSQAPTKPSALPKGQSTPDHLLTIDPWTKNWVRIVFYSQLAPNSSHHIALCDTVSFWTIARFKNFFLKHWIVLHPIPIGFHFNVVVACLWKSQNHILHSVVANEKKSNHEH